jgi:hypothetical protein
MAETLTWIDPSTNQTPLNGETFYTWLQGAGGLYAPPTELIVTDVPLQPGGRFKYVNVGVRDVRLPLMVNANTEPALDGARRALRSAMNPLYGQGTLRHVSQDGQTRDLNCYVVAGMEGDDTQQNRGPGWIFFDLRLKALDPYWYDTNYTTIAFTNAAAVNFLGNPFLPIKLSSSGIFTSFSVSNTGDVEAWPLWTIVGPAVNPTLTNNTTGKSIALTISLTVGQSLTIDTRPGFKTITRENGSNQFSAASPASSLWSLARGLNTITLSVTGSSGASQLQLQYKQRYEGV